MPQIKPLKSQENQTITVNDKKGLREKIGEMFKPTDHVQVINLDDEPFVWTYMPRDAEETNYTSDGQHRQISGRNSFATFTNEQGIKVSKYDQMIPGNQQTWVVNPGQTEVLIGECAYLFVEGMYKTLVAKKKIQETPNQEPTKARNFNWSDTSIQDRLLNKIFLGVMEPNFDGKPKTVSNNS